MLSINTLNLEARQRLIDVQQRYAGLREAERMLNARYAGNVLVYHEAMCHGCVDAG